MDFIIILLLVIVIIVVYGMTVRKKIYKDVDRLEAWKIDIMNRPVTDEMGMVKSLNMIGQTEELFEKWRSKWDEIVTTDLPDVEEALFDIEDYADKYRIKKANLLVRELNESLQKIEDSIQEILDELQNLVGSEERNRIEIEELKQFYRDVKRSLLAHSNSFGKSEATLERILEEVMVKFRVFDELMEKGDVLAANEVVLSIKVQLERMQLLISEIPTLLKDCQYTIPNQLSELMLGVKEMKDQGFVLSHLQIEKGASLIEGQLATYISQLEQAEIDGAKKGVIELQANIESFYDQLESEALSKNFVNQEIHPIHGSIDYLNDDIINTKKETEEVQLSYQLSNQDIEMLRNMESQINQLLKRFSNVKSSIEDQDIAYSVIKNELEDIRNQIEAVKDSHQEFTEMLQTLRKDELYVKEQLIEMRRMLIESKRLVKKSNLPGLPESYLIEINECNQQVVKIAEKLEEKPLHIPVLTVMLKKALEDVEKMSTETKEMLEQAYLVEQVIQYGNRYRGRSLLMSEKLNEAEIAFRHFDYSRALEESATALEKIEPGALKRIQYLVESN